ncbi:bifunctional phosphopantothenoylcysteine decarboxylase/phosphopantothenate--cysteine ligase CoaBC [Helicobacter bizzozeronii]|uniref:bifunctional phosphopantothenoylcysteine decarboxylase/phosphopantothenate--cysteine ligase CoaBC n=1 Tax=Helicobacter bizzozeronii TaxID=56877 RepID=UPI000CF188EE|nr:bifunctional phosphopantothenoylcysteine decarboxylase/phosphopantothenate--cysteine ligase CoaBC [Helicobacter bizzozeronii]
MKTLDLLAQNALLKDRHILLLVSGSIAAYKSLDLVRAFIKMGAKVKVVMSQQAVRFVAPLSFEALSHYPVLTHKSERWDLSDPNCPNHISYAKWAEVVLVAPASANTLAKLAHGLADQLLSATFLASHAPKILAPSMNTQMLEARITQENLARLRSWGCVVVEPREDLLACNTQGKGAMADILELVCASVQALYKNSFWAGKEVVVSGGASIEKIDSVRCICNFSSGLQASALALALYFWGAEVSLIASTFPLDLPASIGCLKVQSGVDFLQALQERANLQDPPFLFMLAAISDYKPTTPHKGKLKKQDLGTSWSLECVQNVDILASLEGFIKIGFKAEEGGTNAITNARKLLESPQNGGKGCLAVCLNTLDSQPFGSAQNQMWLLSAQHSQHTKYLNKLALSFEILNFISQVSHAQSH